MNCSVLYAGFHLKHQKCLATRIYFEIGIFYEMSTVSLCEEFPLEFEIGKVSL